MACSNMFFTAALGYMSSTDHVNVTDHAWKRTGILN